MTDRVYPSAKPNGTTTAAGGITTTNPSPKTQPYNPTRHPYRPQPQPNRRHRSRRSCICRCCFWSTLFVLLLLLLAAIAGCVIYLLYTPHRPSFSITTLKISQFNLSTAASDGTTQLTTTLNLTIFAKNPNKKLIFFYDPISITSLSNQLQIANGLFQNFASYPKNITIIRSVLSGNSQIVDADSVNSLRLDLKKKNGLPLKVVMEMKVVVKIEKLKSKKVGIRVTCDGIHGVVPKGKSPSIASTSDAKCKVHLLIRIWKWTF
ncbi:hypothetical protein CsSME_00044269 [Camellia sinensis var. sinensis]